MSSTIPLLVGLAVAVPVSGTLQRLPRLEGRADVSLWRAATPERLIFGHDGEGRSLFVRAKDSAAVESLSHLGVTAMVGRWQLVHLDAAGLADVLVSAGALELRSTHAHRPMLSLTRAEIGATAVQAGDTQHLGRDGSGVLVGIIDTGIDLTHPAFFDADGCRGSSPSGIGTLGAAPSPSPSGSVTA